MRPALLVLPCLVVGCAAPGPAPPGSPGSAETLVLLWENDVVTKSDGSYTNGVALSWVSKDLRSYPEGSWRHRLGEWGAGLPFTGASEQRAFLGLTLLQEMFTPQDIEDPDPPEDDQPYAGILLLQPTLFVKNHQTCHAWTLRLGVVGPSSGAEQVQRKVHEWVDTDEPRGWDTQLPDEPVLNLDYNVSTEWLAGGPEGSRVWRVVPVGSLNAGTYFTGAGASLYGEVGWNLPELVGLVTVRRGPDPYSAVGVRDRARLSLSTYGGLGGFAVAHYLPLDGTVFRDSRSVDSEPLVGFLTAGIALRYGRFSFSYLVSAFSDQFEGQRSSTEFGSLTLSWSL